MTLSVAAQLLRQEAMRQLANANKRITRLASKDIQGGDIVVERAKAELEAIKALPATNYREIQTVAARARRLDQSAGTRAQSFQKAATRAYRDDLVEQALDPNNVLHMTKDQLAEVYAIQRSRLRDRVRYVQKAIGGNNFMTRKADELVHLDVRGASVNTLRSFVSRSAKTLKSKTLTVEGAKKQLERGIELFGDVYSQMTDEQRGAVWEAMRREMMLGSLSSPDAIELIKTVMEDDKWKAQFFRSETNGEMVAVIGQGLQDTNAKLKKAQIDDRNAWEIIRRGREKWGDKDPNNLNYWSTTTSESMDPLF